MTIEDQVQLALAAPYTRICRRDEEGGVSAEVAELPGCYASGGTIAEAMEELEDAMASWVQAQLEEGYEIPEPSVGPYSGRLNLRIGPRLHERATQLAQAEGISLNRWLTTAIATYAGEQRASAETGRLIRLVAVESLDEAGQARVREAAGPYVIVEGPGEGSA